MLGLIFTQPRLQYFFSILGVDGSSPNLKCAFLAIFWPTIHHKMIKNAHFEFDEDPKLKNNCGLVFSIFNIDHLFQRYLPKTQKMPPKAPKNAHFEFGEDPRLIIQDFLSLIF